MVLCALCKIMIMAQAALMADAHLADAHLQDSADKLVNRARKMWPLNMEETMLGKPGKIGGAVAMTHAGPGFSKPGASSGRISCGRAGLILRPRVCSVASSPFYSLAAKDIDGNEVPFSKLQGKAVLIGNVASK
eukprot:gnl/MRDRNA2_/MRDRNA2_177043_c0_seq1.p1 gnl/MRDRNA2_/MRDRNA2_177043_c0~~gnl/MRDRNA2_/MRDRNA2_177043_c0_seq1.p1  ORF type:complete len:134 (+),score=25.12 gnl/MRDRNA2_/MRDRNA2_177043_c0_seq1:102-503(+)